MAMRSAAAPSRYTSASVRRAPLESGLGAGKANARASVTSGQPVAQETPAETAGDLSVESRGAGAVASRHARTPLVRSSAEHERRRSERPNGLPDRHAAPLSRKVHGPPTACS